MLKKKILAAMCVVVLLAMMSACNTSTEIDKSEDVMATTQEPEDASVTTQTEVHTDDVTSDELTTERDVITTEQRAEEELLSTQSSVSTDDTTTEGQTADMYVGTYNDYDNNEPSLKISLNDDSTYSIQIVIFRLTSLDGVGVLTENGLKFEALDAAGNPIGGVITLEGNEAIVTFTNSTWELLENGTSYRYAKVN